MDTLAVFRSRSEALKIYNSMKHNRIACITVNTPSKLGVGCGISIVFHNSVTNKVKELIKTHKATSFIGFFKK